MPCWQYLDIPYQAYVPLQWAEDLPQMLALGHDRLAYFDQPVHLVGFSMGAYLAAQIALQDPGKVQSLTIIGNNCQALPDAELKQRNSLLVALKQGGFKAMGNKQLISMLHPDNAANSVVINIIREMEQDLGMATLASQLRATSQRKNLIPALAQAKFTTHFMAGKHDHLATELQLHQARQQIAGSTLTLIAQAGHMLPIEQPKQLAEALASSLIQ